MSADPSPVEPLIFRAAKTYIKHGLFPLPIRPGQKSPMLTGWPELTLNDLDLDVFRRPGVNVGLRMGWQPDGSNLYAVDVDPKNGGEEGWLALTAGHVVPITAEHSTPSGGFHLFFDAPDDFVFTNTVIGRGVDTRGHGGQVVAPPSQLPHGAYTFESPIHKTVRASMPLWLMEAFRRAGPVVEAPTPALAGGDDDGPLAWCREHLDWETYLRKHGWQVTGHKGTEVAVKRPGKTEPGNSGYADVGGAFRIFTTDIPAELVPVLRPGRGGVVSCSMLAFIAAYEFGGDMSAAARWVRETYMGGTGLGRRATAPAPATAAVRAGDPTSTVQRLPQVDEAYWEASARNRVIRQAAHNRMVSPDALDVAMFVLQSCLVPPGFMLESPVGPQPLNMLACLVASTGDFKSSTLGAALDLLGPFPPWVDTIGMGSGEGIGAMFLKEEEELDPKTGRKSKTGKLVRNDLKAVFFEADEGSGLSQQMGRKGATIIANLCKSWSGSMLGEGNADVKARRRVLRNDYRIGALVNIQPLNFPLLFSEANTGTGLTGRFMFSGTLDANMPDEEPEWPGQLEFPVWAQAPRMITMDAEIHAAAKAAIRQRHREGGLVGGSQTSQTAASVARMAALIALSEDRYHVSPRDFELAQTRASVSAASLQALESWFGYVQADKGHKAAEAKAAASTGQQEAEDRIWLKKTTDRVMAILQSGPMSAGHVQARLSVKQRPYLEQALAALVDIGQIRLDGERYTRT